MELKDIVFPFSIEETSNELLVAYVKRWRNSELLTTDWTQLPDVELRNKTAWATYRQELRDIPSQGSDPKLWVFPVPPT